MGYDTKRKNCAIKNVCFLLEKNDIWLCFIINEWDYLDFFFNLQAMTVYKNLSNLDQLKSEAPKNTKEWWQEEYIESFRLMLKMWSYLKLTEFKSWYFETIHVNLFCYLYISCFEVCKWR